MKGLIYLLCFVLLAGCNNSEDSETSHNECLKQVEGHKPIDGYKYVKLNIYESLKDSTLFYVICTLDGIGFLEKLNESIDIETLEDFGEFLADKEKVYRYFDTSGGRLILELENADRESFQTFGKSIYAKDKNHIFDSRHGIIENADLNTFEAIRINLNGNVAYGKDRSNYFFWDQIITDTIGFGEELKRIKSL